MSLYLPLHRLYSCAMHILHRLQVPLHTAQLRPELVAVLNRLV